MGIPHFIYPCIFWWTFGLCRLFDCYEKSSINIHIQVFAPTFLFVLSGYLWVEWLGQLVNLCLTFKETTISQSGCAVLHLISNVPISPTLVIVQFSSVAQSCPTLCDPMNHSTPGLPVHHQLPESTQTHVHWVGDAIQPSHPLSSPSPPALNLSQHQGLFQWVSSSRQVAKGLGFPAST